MILRKSLAVVFLLAVVFTGYGLVGLRSDGMAFADVATTPALTTGTASAIVVSGFSVAVVPQEMAKVIKQMSWHKGCPVQISDLRLVSVKYHDYAGNEKQGELIVHKKLALEVRDIFRELYESGFRINSIKRVDFFHGDDNLSMQADNTSAFNFRRMPGSTKFSRHSWGMAVDINPLRNPYVTQHGVLPLQGKGWLKRQDVRTGMIVNGNACYKAFAKRGWKWGGSYKSCKDYQHFEKIV